MNIANSKKTCRGTVKQIIPLVTATLAWFCLGFIPLNASRTDTFPTDYAVYSAVLNGLFITDRTRIVVIDSSTTEGQFWKNASKTNFYETLQQMAVSDEVIRDYEEKNDHIYPLKRLFELRVDYTLISTDEVLKLFKGNPPWWAGFYKKYPNSPGYISLSRVGLNRAMNEALVYIEQRCGGLCAEGKYVKLSRKDGRWRVDKDIVVWAS